MMGEAALRAALQRRMLAVLPSVIRRNLPFDFFVKT